ncbi:acetyl-CoA C-acetyltransferase [Streptococcus moroccensis]|uniref:acetyl-CoA C-acetyltransferase n=1 Tax=Streptococcus moroccensis TaxID=1451356 RepID=A0ABT9YQC9_9STRE|nr:acetyl-CoA C-acetyltransferase [Streptococcus moroccensis]MDQ0222204.1 acetyl-CoA C-acetyltransferase [Streptococcus moroccensis]
MKKVAIVAAKRSAIGSFGGSLQNITIADLGSQVLTQTLHQAKIPKESIDEVILGNVLSAGHGQNIARQIAIRSGLPEASTAYTVNKVCGSGLKSIQLAAQSIMVGDNDLVVAGGVELMSQAPYLDKTSRFGAKLGHQTLEDSIVKDGLTDAFEDIHMGITAETIAERFQFTREQLDRLAFESQEKALNALETNRFADEIVPIQVQKRREKVVFDQDEHPRQTSLDQLAQLRPSFKKDGLLTAGNSSGINDGMAIVVLASQESVERYGLTPLAYIEGWASVGLDPSVMGLGPIPATQKLLKKLERKIEDFDLFEFNEAFASQALAVQQELGVSPDKVNVNGGAIALGHPIGASGARILVSLIHELQKQNGHLGLASLCIGGGQGISMAVSLP